MSDTKLLSGDTPITVWESWDSHGGQYAHNHIENGHVEREAPAGITKQQAVAWGQRRWRKKFAYLRDGKVVYV